MVSLLVLFSGKIATYLEDADEIFLLPKEKEVLQVIHVAARRTYILWSGIQVLVQMLLAPIYLILGLAVWMIVCYILLLLVLKYILVKHQMAQYQSQGVLDWSKAIQDEPEEKTVNFAFLCPVYHGERN